MKKLATIIGTIVCLKAMSKPKSATIVRTVNNYFIKSGGCGGHCGGNCSCGNH